MSTDLHLTPDPDLALVLVLTPYVRIVPVNFSEAVGTLGEVERANNYSGQNRLFVGP